MVKDYSVIMFLLAQSPDNSAVDSQTPPFETTVRIIKAQLLTTMKNSFVLLLLEDGSVRLLDHRLRQINLMAGEATPNSSDLAAMFQPGNFKVALPFKDKTAANT